MTEEFTTQNFEGSIVLKDWMRWRDGRSFIGFTGKISILQDTELVGFKSKGNESNWVARIAGATESVNILGCQIRGAVVHEVSREPAADYLLVP